jgi:hypothetical protein
VTNTCTYHIPVSLNIDSIKFNHVRNKIEYLETRIWITKLRTSNLKILIEAGRWRNIPVEESISNICNENIGNEFHHLFIYLFASLQNW